MDRGRIAYEQAKEAGATPELQSPRAFLAQRRRIARTQFFVPPIDRPLHDSHLSLRFCIDSQFPHCLPPPPAWAPLSHHVTRLFCRVSHIHVRVGPSLSLSIPCLLRALKTPSRLPIPTRPGSNSTSFLAPITQLTLFCPLQPQNTCKHSATRTCPSRAGDGSDYA